VLAVRYDSPEDYKPPTSPCCKTCKYMMVDTHAAASVAEANDQAQKLHLHETKATIAWLSAPAAEASEGQAAAPAAPHHPVPLPLRDAVVYGGLRLLLLLV